ncbi:hypothetical protein BJ508DRAFT_416690 [Ascobolus immersus RN42]|uniref:RNA ligase/cyclic nucleotide phosphodiesterase n=1 Tax=Ascobolus immersus RN42 TaxID=1160509 RepID=A0A3N4I8D8_ASCIM|nr:hypothetical protein BJ508DRAFT_416690 [Ascobolus immersus RN42]
MPAVLTAIGTDAQNSFEDLSGICTPTLLSPAIGGVNRQLFATNGSDGNGLGEIEGGNPYDAMLYLSNEDPAVISKAYQTHRTLRNAKFTKMLRSPEFDGVNIDPILVRVEQAKREGRAVDDAVDPRHCLVFWARPPERIRQFVKTVQERLRNIAPDLWIMPEDCLHMTVLEITHSTTSETIESLVDTIAPSLPDILAHTKLHRARLTAPLLSFDAAAMAISFLPSPAKNDKYTYHHLRRDLYGLCRDAGVEVDSRYVLPSAHITVARFVENEGLKGKMEEWMREVEGINAWLREECGGVNWEVGEERGLDCRRGQLWYGGGDTVGLGEGF